MATRVSAATTGNVIRTTAERERTEEDDDVRVGEQGGVHAKAGGMEIMKGMNSFDFDRLMVQKFRMVLLLLRELVFSFISLFFWILI